MLGQQIAIKLEITARRALNIKKQGGMAGVISADFIEKDKGAFTVLCTAIAPYYLNTTSDERQPLDEIIERYRHLQDCSLEEYFKATDRATEELKTLLDNLGVQDALE
ncbi:hypothetical protein [Aquibacillus saliphilus]|uniref:hypothetical protein n=1 Tax=Aquibacillus saliphilus TaxID=1909422 RepID=UPI001CF0768E|nr:hypothetical protein [Aquibacillus saliphilus]